MSSFVPSWAVMRCGWVVQQQHPRGLSFLTAFAAVDDDDDGGSGWLDESDSREYIRRFSDADIILFSPILVPQFRVFPLTYHDC